MSKQAKSAGLNEKLAATGCALSAIYLLPAATVQADAVVNTNSITVNIGDPQAFWDVDGDGSDEFELHTGAVGGSSYSALLDTYDSFNNVSLDGRGMVQNTTNTSEDLFAPLSPGVSVGPSLATGYQWGSSQQTWRTMIASSGSAVGGDAASSGFVSGGDQYFGFRFDRSGQTHYGWAEVSFDTSGSPGGYTIVRWGYEDQPNTAIAVGGGATSAATPVPVGGLPVIGLAMLGLGAAGLRELRRRRKGDQGESLH